MNAIKFIGIVGKATAISAGCIGVTVGTYLGLTKVGCLAADKFAEALEKRRRNKDNRTEEEILNNVVSIQEEEDEPEKEGAH